MLSTIETKITLQEYKEGLEVILDICLLKPVTKAQINDINKIYNIIYSQDTSIEYLKKDIDIINQGKAILDDDTRELTDKEIKEAISYIKCDPKCETAEEKETLKRIARKIIKMRPEYEKEFRFLFMPKYIY